MKKKVALFAILSVIAVFIVGCSQGRPDLVLKSMECREGKFFFTVVNEGDGPLPEDWIALASVYVDGVVQEDIDLKSPSTTEEGGIQEAGGTSHYLTVFNIEKPTRFDVIIDYTKEIEEKNEDNNRMENVYLEPCNLPDLTITEIGLDENCFVTVTVKNEGEGPLPESVWDVNLKNGSGVTLLVQDEERSHAPFWKMDAIHALDTPGNEIIYTSTLKVNRAVEIKAVIDAAGKVYEANENNNEMTETLTCSK